MYYWDIFNNLVGTASMEKLPNYASFLGPLVFSSSFPYLTHGEEIPVQYISIIRVADPDLFGSV
jgi:hypothetical protein